MKSVGYERKSVLRELFLQFRAILALTWLNGLLAIVRNPLWVISDLTPPLGILVMLSFLGREELIGYGIVGGLAMIFTHNGLGLMTDATFYRLELKFQDMVVASPVKSWSYMLGLALSGLLFSMPGTLTFLAILASLGLRIVDPVQMVLASIALWASSTSIGFTISTLFRDMREVWPTSSILIYSISVLPPVYYPYSLLPTWAQAPVLLIPTASGALLIQESMGLITPDFNHKLFAWTALLLNLLVFSIIAAKKSRWRQP